MDLETALHISQNSLLVLLKITLPVLLLALVTGLFISLIQALTQIQEATLSFVPKLIVTFVTLILMAPYIGKTFYSFTEEIMSLIITL